MSDQSTREPSHKTGRVTRTGPQFGFLTCDDIPEHDIYYKNSWLRSGPPLRQGETVTFELVDVGGNLQAHHLQRIGDQRTAPDRSVIPYQLFEWAYLGYLPNCLSELAGLALPEHWEFKNSPPNPDKPMPILYSYLVHTFGRLVLEGKVLINQDRSYAAFNTGMVDRRYEPIHALFVPNTGRVAWQLSGFCVAGEGADGQNLVRNFAPLPRPAHYFADPRDLLYDVSAGEPQLDWRHVILDRIDRYPREFVEDNLPRGFYTKGHSGSIR